LRSQARSYTQTEDRSLHLVDAVAIAAIASRLRAVRTIEVKNRTSGCRPRSPPSAINRPAGAPLARSRSRTRTRAELAMSLTDTSSGGSPD